MSVYDRYYSWFKRFDNSASIGVDKVMADFDAYMDKVVPLATTIAFIKSELASRFYENLVKEIEKDQRRKLEKGEKEALFRAIRQFVSELTPEIFDINLDWQPTEEEVKKKLEDLKTDKRLRETLKKHLLKRLAVDQLRLDKSGIHE